MKRSEYFNYIEEKLDFLAYRIEKRGKINLLDLNIYSEGFFADVLNIVFDYRLVNLNAVKQNVEGIDLVDAFNRIIVQVSSVCTKQKIESALEKEIFLHFSGYRFKFLSISKDASKLRKQEYDSPKNVNFSAGSDILDVNSILSKILDLSIDRQKQLYDLIRKELGDEINIVSLDTNIATIMNILAAEDLNEKIGSLDINGFEIDKKIEFNDLQPVKDIIDEYKVYYHRLDEKYSEFDKRGANKSISIFRVLKAQYLKLSPKSKDSCDLFFAIINEVIEMVMNSKNYIAIPYEELEMCVNIIVVDAFVRCKIFENPEGYDHVVAR